MTFKKRKKKNKTNKTCLFLHFTAMIWSSLQPAMMNSWESSFCLRCSRLSDVRVVLKMQNYSAAAECSVVLTQERKKDAKAYN